MKGKRGVNMLNYKKCEYDFNGNTRLSSMLLFEQAERRLKNKREALEDMQNEFNLLERQAFETYKSNISYDLIGAELYISLSKKWLQMFRKNKDDDGNKLDGRKKYKEKETYEHYINMIKKYLGIDSMDNISFIDYNFGEATEIEFTYLDQDWQLRIPRIQNIKLKSYRNGGKSIFKLSLWHKSSNLLEMIDSTYEEDDLKDIMSKGIEKWVGCGDKN